MKNTARISAALLSGLAIAALASAEPPVSWDLTAQFSTGHGNPNGPWSYGWYDTSFSNFTLFNPGVWCDACPGWYIGPTGDWTPNIVMNSCGCFNQFVVPIGWVTFHPGPSGQVAATRFTVPEGVSGQVRVAGEFLPGDGGWMQVAVRFNGTEVFRAGNAGVFDMPLSVHPGDAIEFAVFGGYAFGNTPVRAVITAETCPADVGMTGGIPGADGALDNNDFVVFIDYFFGHDPRADRGTTGGIPGTDGEWNNNDFIVFIDQFFTPC